MQLSTAQFIRQLQIRVVREMCGLFKQNTTGFKPVIF